MAGQAVDDEVAVGGHSVEAARGHGQASVCAGEIVDERCAEHVLVCGRDRSVPSLRINSFVAMMMLGNREVSVVTDGASVLNAMLALQEEHGKATQLERFGIAGCEPGHDLSRDSQWSSQVWQH